MWPSVTCLYLHDPADHVFTDPPGGPPGGAPPGGLYVPFLGHLGPPKHTSKGDFRCLKSGLFSQNSSKHVLGVWTPKRQNTHIWDSRLDTHWFFRPPGGRLAKHPIWEKWPFLTICDKSVVLRHSRPARCGFFGLRMSVFDILGHLGHLTHFDDYGCFSDLGD